MRYMLAIIGDESGWEDVTEEQMQEVMAAWQALDRRMVDAGVWRAGDGLKPSAGAKTVKIEGEDRIVTDGPFAETKEQLGGFYLLECDSLDEAVEWAKQLPVRDGAVEVREVMDYGPDYSHPMDRETTAA